VFTDILGEGAVSRLRPSATRSLLKTTKSSNRFITLKPGKKGKPSIQIQMAKDSFFKELLQNG
jgi:hypothetical protein